MSVHSHIFNTQIKTRAIDGFGSFRKMNPDYLTAILPVADRLETVLKIVFELFY